MKTLQFQRKIDPDGKLRLEVKAELPPGPVEGVVVQQAQPQSNPQYDVLRGAFVGQLSADIDIDAALHEMNQEIGSF